MIKVSVPGFPVYFARAQVDDTWQFANPIIWQERGERPDCGIGLGAWGTDAEEANMVFYESVDGRLSLPEDTLIKDILRGVRLADIERAKKLAGVIDLFD